MENNKAVGELLTELFGAVMSEKNKGKDIDQVLREAVQENIGDLMDKAFGSKNASKEPVKAEKISKDKVHFDVNGVSDEVVEKNFKQYQNNEGKIILAFEGDRKTGKAAVTVHGSYDEIMSAISYLIFELSHQNQRECVDNLMLITTAVKAQFEV